MKNFDDEFHGYRALKKEAQLLQRRKRVFDDERNVNRYQEKKKQKRIRHVNVFNEEI